MEWGREGRRRGGLEEKGEGAGQGEGRPRASATRRRRGRGGLGSESGNKDVGGFGGSCIEKVGGTRRELMSKIQPKEKRRKKEQCNSSFP